MDGLEHEKALSSSRLRVVIGTVRDMVALRSTEDIELVGSSAPDPTGERSDNSNGQTMDSLKHRYRQSTEALAQSLQRMGNHGVGTCETDDLMDEEHGGCAGCRWRFNL